MAKKTIKINPSDAQKVALEAIRKVAHPFIRMRRTRTVFPSATEVELYVYPPFTINEEDRLSDLLEDSLKAQGLKFDETSVGTSFETDWSRVEGVVSLKLSK